MKTFVFTYDRFDSITTSPMLEAENIPHVTLCHTDAQRQSFIDHGRVKPETLIATGNPRGLAYNRNTALDMMEDGEWALFLVDDLISVSELNNYDRATSPLPITMANQRTYNDRFDSPITMTRFLERAEQYARLCEQYNCNLGGWAGINNTIFRSHHYRTNVLADGRAWIVRKTALRFDENVQLIDDLCWTALNIKHFGIVIVDQWLLPDCRRYSKGAFGSITDRMEQKLSEAAYLAHTYPDLITFKEKAGWPSGAHVVLRQQRNKRRVR
jgi:hypothetical protein